MPSNGSPIAEYRRRLADPNETPERKNVALNYFARKKEQKARKRDRMRAAAALIPRVSRSPAEQVIAERAKARERAAKPIKIGAEASTKNKATLKAKREAQAGRPRPDHCEICGEESQFQNKTIHWDHDHATGAFRGWLCVRCNHTLGKVKDSVSLLKKMIDYLENPPGPGSLAEARARRLASVLRLAA